MITNKDLRVEGGNLIINGEKHPLDPAAEALTKRANIVQGKFSALDTRRDAIEALEKTASGNPISLTGAAAAYAISNIMTIEPIQSGSGDPSPTNIRPISGITEAVVTRNGKNLFNLSTYPQTYTSAGVTHTINASEGKISFHRVSANTGNHYYTSSEAYKLKAGSYVLSAVFPAGITGVRVGIDNGNVFLDASGEVNFTLTEDSNINLYLFYASTQSEDVTISDIMIRSARFTDSTFEPYTAATATITLGQTVYGGSVNFKTGEVTVTHANIESYNGESINEPWLSSMDKYVSGATPSTGAQVVYPLTTPTTLTLTPAELELLKGNNTVSGNGANINLSYIGR